MKLTTTNMQVQQESNLGVYLWKLPNGNLLADTDGNMLSIDAIQGDISAMAKMQRAAKAVGYPEGRPVWEAAHKCSSEEYEEQLEELKNGKNPNVRLARRY